MVGEVSTIFCLLQNHRFTKEGNGILDKMFFVANNITNLKSVS